MNNKTSDAYITKTPQEEIEICEKCPHPYPKCGDCGCSYFRRKKAELKNKKKVEKHDF